jgi:hypothetical protein
MSSISLDISAVKTQLQTSGKRSHLFERRNANINWVRALNRRKLVFGYNEKQILMAQTRYGEQLFIQYPGKESIIEGDKHRPWDFRPKLILPDGNTGADLTFNKIWGGLYERAKELSNEVSLNNVSKGTSLGTAWGLLATVFYRMAFMLDHQPADNQRLEAWSVTIKSNEETRTSRRVRIPATNLFLYNPSTKVIDELSSVFPGFCGMSLEAFLYYNDLLAWNEDCKYYYRDFKDTDVGWTKKEGRLNNLLSHISVIGLILGHVSLSSVLSKAMRGVFPPNINELLTICSPYLVPRNTQSSGVSDSQLSLLIV